MDDLRIGKLVGHGVTEDDLANVDCYVHDKIGLFVPSTGRCGYAEKKNHTHPSYMVTIIFSFDNAGKRPRIKTSRNHYPAAIISPGVGHDDIFEEYNHYYCIMIDKAYFESQYALYSKRKPRFENKRFEICADIIKTLNGFAFEISKEMQNSDITLSAQETLITHWIIRSILGENMDMRSISSSYPVARAQQYIAQNYGSSLTVDILAANSSVSVSTLQRLFRRETGMSPAAYIVNERVEKSKTLLRRKNISMTEIALMCGFADSSHFSVTFRGVTGVTPSEYRSAYKD